MPDALARTKQGRETAHRILGPARGVVSALADLGLDAARWLARCASKRPASTAAGAAFAALMVGVALNALVFQRARHPAPLFEAPAAAQEAAPAAGAAAPQAAEAPAPADGLDRAPTGTVPTGPDAAAPQGAPLGAADAPPADAPAADGRPPAADQPDRAAKDADAGPKQASKKRSPHHAKTATKKAKGRDQIAKYLGSPSSKGEPGERRHHRPKKSED